MFRKVIVIRLLPWASRTDVPRQAGAPVPGRAEIATGDLQGNLDFSIVFLVITLTIQVTDMLRLSQILFCALTFIGFQLAIATGLRVGGWTGFWMAAVSIFLLALLVMDEMAGVDAKKMMVSQPQEERRKRERERERERR
ncbi:hypothetical protein ABID21_000059 [Pseudorhizobium tarimense]|uniref:Uncharacterized protein n=1 Tax=Pseudorhizobium tarimense TaxID=1079109 RepID=A0ABV2H0M1_9HYPH|nr:hypothetical protein [Pseudorhizobium tarimense]MCJ8517313.1 hypothetical protein [Pseudorhizobium tarimense]